MDNDKVAIAMGMNQIEMTMREGLSRKQLRVINITVGAIIASDLDREDKEECVMFLRDLETFVDDLRDEN